MSRELTIEYIMTITGFILILGSVSFSRWMRKMHLAMGLRFVPKLSFYILLFVYVGAMFFLSGITHILGNNP